MWLNLMVLQQWQLFLTSKDVLHLPFEPPRDKTNKMTVRPAAAQSDRRPVWSVFAVHSMGN